MTHNMKHAVAASMPLLFGRRNTIGLLLIALNVFLLLPLYSAEVTFSDKDESVIAQTTYGPVEGRRVQLAGIDADVFRGIPYAEAPERQLRFQRPEPPSAWQQPLDCRHASPRCTQFQSSNHSRLPLPDGAPEDSEQCLTVNVYTKHQDEVNKKPVLFFVHGGSFIGGSALEWGVEGPLRQFVAHDVLLVLVQYRLGPLGFLSVPHQPQHSNVALWDLAAALDWVHDNIGAFGGDAGRITVAGHSAGAVLASLLDVSPVTSGKFHGLWLMSSCASAEHMLVDGAVDQASERLAATVGCDLPSSTQMLHCLQSKDVSELQTAFTRLALDSPLVGFQRLFLPAFGDEFLPVRPSQVLAAARSTDKPVVIGVTDGEMAANEDSSAVLSYAAWQQLVEAEFAEEGAGVLRELVLHEYVHRHGRSHDQAFLHTQMLKLISDIVFYAPTAKEAKLRSQSESKVWLYEFAFWQPHNFHAFVPPERRAAFHGLDTAYLFLTPIWVPLLMPHFQFNRLELSVAEHWADKVVHFVKHGTPVSDAAEWPVYDAERGGQYLVVNESSSRVDEQFHANEDAFWNELLVGVARASLDGGRAVPHKRLLASQGDDDEQWAWQYRQEDEL